MKIGVYGGSFNPPHKFHKEIVKFLLDNKYLDKVIVVPTGDSYKKRDAAPFINRLEMTNIMFNDIALVSSIGNEGYEYTYQVMDYFQEKYPNDEIYFIMGEDNYSEISTWMKYDYLIKKYKFLVVSRNNLHIEDKDYIIRVKELKENDISSSMIRERIKNNQDVEEYLSKEVIDYIKKYNLYDYKKYKNEGEFLKDYNPNNYPSFALATDILIFSISSVEDNNYKKLDQKKMSILLVKRDTYPYKDRWCIPGGFVGINENLEDAPKRILKNETGLENIYLEQLYTFGEVNRDPRMRVISSSYMALIDKDLIHQNIKDNVSWFDVLEMKESNGEVFFSLSNGKENVNFKVKKDDYSIIYNDLAFDNPLIIVTGYERLKNKIEYTDIVFHMMPELFTLGELQKVYELILNKKLLDPAFRRIIANKVESTNQYKTGEGHRPSRLFKYKSKS